MNTDWFVCCNYIVVENTLHFSRLVQCIPIYSILNGMLGMSQGKIMTAQKMNLMK